VTYEAAFAAFKNGDFQAAVPLLEKLARETGYTSDVVNHAYTLALHHAGDKARLAEVAYRVGNLLIEQDPASAMDYFQRALLAGLDTKRIRRIGELHEQWAAPRPAAFPERKPVARVAHVVGCVLSGHAPTQYLKMLVSSLRRQGIESTVFTTEWAASWFFNPQGVPQSERIDMDAELHIGSVEGDFLQRSMRIAEDLRGTGIHAAFFHASLTEQITARVASMRPAAVQINVNHGSEMDADLFDGRIHLFQNALRRTRFSGRSEWIPLASDIETRLAMSPPLSRQDVGLESAGSISATFGNLYKVAAAGYLRVLTEILRRFPNHFHLFAGAGNVRLIRSHLHSEGVLPRVRFLGHVADVAPLLPMLDVYLASFPHSGGHSVLEAMGAGKPVVVLRYPPDSHYNSGAELVGIRELTAAGEADYIDIADRLLRNSELRARQSQAVLARFRAEFQPDRLGERYKAFIEPLL
jgi:glycosyltransferase involved in cell wall biosynthesis